MDFAYIGQPDARIAQLAFEDGLDLLAQSFAESFPVILLAAPFQRITPSKTDENIRKWLRWLGEG